MHKMFQIGAAAALVLALSGVARAETINGTAPDAAPAATAPAAPAAATPAPAAPAAADPAPTAARPAITAPAPVADAPADTSAKPHPRKPATRRMSHNREIDHSIESGTVPSRYRNSVPREYQHLIPFDR